MVLTGSRKIIGKAVTSGQGQDALPPRKLRTRFERTDHEDRAVWTVHPKSGPSDRLYIHFHGGAFVLGLNALHYETMAKLCDLSGVSISLPDYPYVPSASSEKMQLWAAGYVNATMKEYGSANIIIGGDSAGANLALVNAMGRRKAKLKPAEALLLMSPWVDLEMAASHHQDPTDDIFLVTEDLQAAARAYAGERDIRDPSISPAFGDLSNLPPIHIFTGERDRLHKDILTFADRVNAEGHLAKLAVFGEFGHMWMIYPTPDRNDTLDQFAAILRGK